MAILFIGGVVLLSLLLGIFGGAAVLYFVSKWFKAGFSYKTSVKILVLAGVCSLILGFVVDFASILFGVNVTIAQLAEFVVGFFVFSYFLKKYGQVSWAKALGIYVSSTLAWLILTFVVIIPIRLFVFQPFLVSGDAMSPTYPSGEYLLINELSKNYSRRDVVVFRYPVDPSEYFIKRIVGLPSETLSVKNGQVLINGEVLTEPYIATSTPGDTSLTLGPNEYFVMGDNRQASNDSRDFGSIQKSSILGKVLFDVGNF